MSEVAHTSEGVAQPAKLGGANQVAIACSAVEATLMSPERRESLLMLLLPAERALGRGCALAPFGGSSWLHSRDSSCWTEPYHQESRDQWNYADDLLD